VYILAALFVVLIFVAGALIIGILRDPDFLANSGRRFSDWLGRQRQAHIRRAESSAARMEQRAAAKRERVRQVALREQAEERLRQLQQRKLYLALQAQLQDEKCRAVLNDLVGLGARLTLLFQANIFPFDTQPLVMQLADIGVACSQLGASREFVQMAIRIHQSFLEVCKLVPTVPTKKQHIIGGGFGFTGAVRGIAMAEVANWLLNSGVGGKQRSVFDRIDWNLQNALHGIQFLSTIQNAEATSGRRD
jgi:hypothetical protein